MENRLTPSLVAQFEELARERERLAEVVAAYRIVRASRFSRLRDLVLAAKRAIWHVDEPPALEVLNLPAFRL